MAWRRTNIFEEFSEKADKQREAGRGWQVFALSATVAL